MVKKASVPVPCFHNLTIIGGKPITDFTDFLVSISRRGFVSPFVLRFRVFDDALGLTRAEDISPFLSLA